jgi:hypothetical protein
MPEISDAFQNSPLSPLRSRFRLSRRIRRQNTRLSQVSPAIFLYESRQTGCPQNTAYFAGSHFFVM